MERLVLRGSSRTGPFHSRWKFLRTPPQPCACRTQGFQTLLNLIRHSPAQTASAVRGRMANQLYSKLDPEIIGSRCVYLGRARRPLSKPETWKFSLITP